VTGFLKFSAYVCDVGMRVSGLKGIHVNEPCTPVEQILIVFSSSFTLTELIIMMGVALVTKCIIRNLSEKAKARQYELLISLT